MYSCCISLTQWMCILLLSEVLAKQSGPFLEFIFLFSPSSHRFSSRLFAPKHPLRTVLCPCFPFPLIKMNPGNIWTQKVSLSGEGEGHLRSETNGHRSLLHPYFCKFSFFYLFSFVLQKKIFNCGVTHIQEDLKTVRY